MNKASDKRRSDARATSGAVGAVADERVRRTSWFARQLSRPDLGAISGAILVFVFFGIVAGDSGMFSSEGVQNWATVSAELGIITVGAAMLMIAGEFDLSIGSMIGFSGMMIAIPATFFHWPLWTAIIFAFSVAVAIGALNGYIVVRTRLPSFIVSLAFLFILRGLTLALSIIFTNRTIVSGFKEAAGNDFLGSAFGGRIAYGVFQWLADIGIIGKYSDGTPLVAGLPMSIVWWIGLTALGSWVLTRTRFGNWIFACGGDVIAARNMGVPVKRVKIILFMVTAFCATVFATCQVIQFDSAAADRGLLKEFEAIIAAVIGGNLLTGGYGSVVGAAFGALIFGVVQMGIFYTNVSTDWFRVFLGVVLLIAVAFNTFVRQKVTGSQV
jgi:simple sugar transport system permease protein